MSVLCKVWKRAPPPPPLSQFIFGYYSPSCERNNLSKTGLMGPGKGCLLPARLLCLGRLLQRNGRPGGWVGVGACSSTHKESRYVVFFSMELYKVTFKVPFCIKKENLKYLPQILHFLSMWNIFKKVNLRKCIVYSGVLYIKLSTLWKKLIL